MTSQSGSRQLIRQMNQYYEARAPYHDEYMSFESPEKMEELLRPVIDIVEPLVVGKTVLEIACGTGNWTQYLSKHAKSVMATDYSPTVLKLAQQKFPDLDNVTFREHSAYELGRVEGQFDIVFAADWWSHIPNSQIESFLKGVIGKLKPRSKAIFLDMSLNDYFRNEPCEYDSDNNRVSIRELPDGSKHKVVKNFPTEEELRKIIAPFSGRVDYYHFESLERWMVVLESADL